MTQNQSLLSTVSLLFLSQGMYERDREKHCEKEGKENKSYPRSCTTEDAVWTSKAGKSWNEKPGFLKKSP